MKSTNISHSRVLELLNYDPVSGVMTRKITVSYKAKAGDIAGWVGNHGYRQLALDGKQYLAHRVAWFYVTGNWPDVIDHINRDISDNRFSNLRSVTSAENSQNVAKEKGFKIGTSLAGATWDKYSKSWKASICINGKQKHLGRFKTDVDAHQAYVAAKRTVHPGNML